MTRVGHRTYHTTDTGEGIRSDQMAWRESCILSNIAFVNALNLFFAKRAKGVRS